MQTFSEREKHNNLFEEQATRLRFIEREKNKLDEIVKF